MAAVLTVAAAGAGPSTWHLTATGTEARLRGVSAVSETVAWASGEKGTVLRTTDGGKSWERLVVPGAEALDFRDIEARDAQMAYVLAIGPGEASRIYKTADGGRGWNTQFTNRDPKAFYDAIAFWDARTGLAFGDPVDGRFTVIRTNDGGATWSPVPPANVPPALPGEGAFAASGTCLVVEGTKNAWFASGGASVSRVFRSTDQGLTWSVADTPVAAGLASAGIFSLAFSDSRNGIAVGGDYKKEGEASDNVAVTRDGGATWTFGTRLPGFRSAVAFLPGTAGGRRLVATGPSGSDVSEDGGVTWAPVPGPGFHALSVAAKGGGVWAAGEKGRAGVLTASRPISRD